MQLQVTAEVPDHELLARAADVLAAQPGATDRPTGGVTTTITLLRQYAGRLARGLPLNQQMHPPYEQLADQYMR